jgi:hypothetical protein
VLPPLLLLLLLLLLKLKLFEGEVNQGSCWILHCILSFDLALIHVG